LIFKTKIFDLLEVLVNIATAKWFCNCSGSLRPADCVVKPRRCAASPAFYALSTELMKTDHFTKPLRGGYKYGKIPGLLPSLYVFETINLHVLIFKVKRK
jgi:hypothetical protein